MPLLPPVRCERRLTACLSLRERHELSSLAAGAAPGLDPAYLLERFARYEQVWVARRGSRAAGFLLAQEIALPAASVTYIGPAFSRAGAYAYAFGALMGARLCGAQPFLIAMEVQNPSVRRMLEQLVPSYLFPRAEGAQHMPESLRRLAEDALARVSHVIDFDPRSMTSAIAGCDGEISAAARYQVLLVACDGSLQTRASLTRELARGLRELSVRPQHVSGLREARGG